MDTVDVAIVGAGPTGLALATGLRAAGVDARLLDRAAAPATTSRALGLQPRGVEVLDRLGALGDLPARSLPVEEVAVVVDGAPLARLDLRRPTRLVPRPGLIMSQVEVEDALRRRLAELGGAVELGWEFTGLAPDEHGVVLTSAAGDQVRARWVVGADGAHSRVREQAGIGFPGVPLAERFVLADVHADLPTPRTAVTTFLGAEGMLALFPLPGEGLWRLLAARPGTDETAPEPDRATVVAALLDGLERTAHLCADTVRDVVWASSFRIHRRLASSYRADRVLVAGDAAHVHSPFGGQGMNTGLGDAENLAWKLAAVVRGRARPGLLDTYAAERRPVATEVLSSTSGMTRVMLGGTAATRLLRDRVVVPAMNRPAVQRRIKDASSQLRVTYRRGPLGVRGAAGWRRGTVPGDRLPDRACRRADGSPTRLSAELGGRWVLLDGDGDALRTARERLGGDAVVALTTAPGTPPGRWLVRPDGHVACPADAVASWLGRALDAGPAAGPPRRSGATLAR
jgi:4,5-epoxidase